MIMVQRRERWPAALTSPVKTLPLPLAHVPVRPVTFCACAAPVEASVATASTAHAAREVTLLIIVRLAGRRRCDDGRVVEECWSCCAAFEVVALDDDDEEEEGEEKREEASMICSAL